MKTLELSRSLERPLAGGHRWVYREQLPKGFLETTGSWVRVRAGSYSGYGVYDEEGAIAVRIVSDRGVVDAAWIAQRVRAAYELRAALRQENVTGYRLLHGEGDGLPGIIVDVYDQVAIIVTYSSGVQQAMLSSIVLALEGLASWQGIALRSEAGTEWLKGSRPGSLWVNEHGMQLEVDLESGQKTGLFFDQRDNRRTLRGLAHGKSVLNLFSYTGAFSVAAALGGTSRVVSVDSAKPAVEAGRRNLEANAPEVAAEHVVADVFGYLDALQERFDIVIADPPSFARNRSQRDRAIDAYVRLHAACMKATNEGGLYVAASCTAQVEPEAFRKTLADGARRARCRFQIIHEAGQPLDHPVFAGHPESRYLKFLVGRVLKAV